MLHGNALDQHHTGLRQVEEELYGGTYWTNITLG